MISIITAECSCGKKWKFSNTSEIAKSLWVVLEITDDGIIEKMKEENKPLDVEWAVRIITAKHSLKYNNNKHRVDVIKENIYVQPEEIPKKE